MVEREVMSAVLEGMAFVKASVDSLKETVDRLQGEQAITNRRLEGIENRLENVENRLENVENRLENVENRLENVENRLENVEDKIETLATKEETNKRFDSLEKKYDQIAIFISVLNNIIRGFRQYSHIVNSIDEPFDDDIRMAKKHVS